jgi:hypothetical protein
MKEIGGKRASARIGRYSRLQDVYDDSSITISLSPCPSWRMAHVNGQRTGQKILCALFLEKLETDSGSWIFIA